MTQAGYLATAQILMTSADTGLVAVGLVALPRVAAMTVPSRRDELIETVSMLLPCTFQIAVFAQVQALVWADTGAAMLLGAHSDAAVPFVRVVLTAVGGYVAYVMLRAVIDAVEIKPINAFHLLVSLPIATVAAAVAVAGGFGLLGVAAAQSLGVNALGGLSIIYLARRYGVPASSFQFLWAIGLSAVAGAVGLASHEFVRGLYGPAVEPAIGAVVISVTLMGYLLALNALGARWVSAANAGMGAFLRRWTA